HVEDLKKTCPAGCKGQKSGTAHPTGDPKEGGRCPALVPDKDYWTWRVGTECKAYHAELDCLRPLYKEAREERKEGEIIAPKDSVKVRIKAVRKSLRYWHNKDEKVCELRDDD